MSNKMRVTLIAVIAGILACIIVVFAILFIFTGKKSTDLTETTVGAEGTTVQTDILPSATQKTDDVTENEVVTVYVPVYIGSETEAADKNSYANTDTSDNQTVLRDNCFYTVSGTPDSAGLVMRSAASSTSDKLGVLPEGSRVYVYSDDASNKTGYVRVLATVGNGDLHCYVLKQYLEFESVFTANEASDESVVRYVSFSTPDHAGINLRAEPSAASELICTIYEGERVEIVKGEASVNGYVKIVYAHPHAGDYFYGWVLEKHLVK